MREPLRDKGRLLHILEAIDNLAVAIPEDYYTNHFIRYGVVKELEIIGEAAYMLSKSFKAQHTEVRWEVIIAMRHVLVHGYYQINDEQVWNIIQNDLPQLREQVKEMLVVESNNPSLG
ncbi:DUF86 domain-containing protein [Bacteroidia bacterium]|nr:DUF86 domain-containing protein [Bacteroidia bacterium]